MGEPHPAALPLKALAAQCEIKFTRGSGPGGQNRNKVETAVVLRHLPTGLIAEASERRTQGTNHEAAVFRLRLKLALTVRSEVGPGRPPSELWRSRCRGGRLSVSPTHDDFPAILAEALDSLHAHHDDPRSAADDLGCSPSQLLKLIKVEPRAWLALNARRKSKGLGPLL